MDLGTCKIEQALDVEVVGGQDQLEQDFLLDVHVF